MLYIKVVKSISLVAFCVIIGFFTCTSSAFAFSVGLQQDNMLQSPDPRVQKQTIEQMDLLGANHLRLSGDWARIAAACANQPPLALENPLNTCYDWGYLDNVVSTAQDHQMEVVLSVWKRPAWLFKNPSLQYTGCSPVEFTQFENHFISFMTAMATRYSRKSKIGYVKYWTIWNEPNSHTFWQPHTDSKTCKINSSTPALRYASLYQMTTPKIKQASPTSQVALGPFGASSLPAKPLDYLNQVLPYLADTQIDTVAINPYQKLSPDQRSFSIKSGAVGLGNIQDLLDTLDSYPQSLNANVWVTEFAYQSNPPETTDYSVPLDTQALWGARALRVAQENPRIELFGWYVMRDPDFKQSPLDWQSGMFTANGVKKPLYYAFKSPISVNYNLDGTTHIWTQYRANLTEQTKVDLVWADNVEMDNYQLIQVRKNNDGVLSADVFLPVGAYIKQRLSIKGSVLAFSPLTIRILSPNTLDVDSQVMQIRKVSG